MWRGKPTEVELAPIGIWVVGVLPIITKLPDLSKPEEEASRHICHFNGNDLNCSPGNGRVAKTVKALVSKSPAGPPQELLTWLATWAQWATCGDPVPRGVFTKSSHSRINWWPGNVPLTAEGSRIFARLSPASSHCLPDRLLPSFLKQRTQLATLARQWPMGKGTAIRRILSGSLGP